MTPIPLSLYIHFPWCLHKCPYCDFNSHQAQGDLPEQRYIDALLKDLEQELPQIWGRPLHTVFIGGGTPSLISAQGMQCLMSGLNALLPMRPAMEVTLEANPGTFEQARFSAYRQAGITRLSIGIQSFHETHLKRLERIHDAKEAHQAATIARNVGFDNFNLDLMFGLPEQTIAEALEDLQQAIDYQPPHLSWYQLTLEPNTLFYHQRPELPDSDRIADMHEQGMTLLADNGYEQYEVSAYAQPDKQCQHNRNYWQFGDYVGIGAGAHGKITQGKTITRRLKYKHPQTYMSACLDNPVANPLSQAQELDHQERVFEFMLNALRLRETMPKTLFEQRTGLTADALLEGTRKAVTKGLMTETESEIILTERGWNFLNETVACYL